MYFDILSLFQSSSPTLLFQSRLKHIHQVDHSLPSPPCYARPSNGNASPPPMKCLLFALCCGPRKTIEKCQRSYTQSVCVSAPHDNALKNATAFRAKSNAERGFVPSFPPSFVGFVRRRRDVPFLPSGLGRIGSSQAGGRGLKTS